MACLSLKQIHKKYGPISVLNGIDLDVKDGEFLTLVGASGCGKSTLVRIIAGLEPQTSGSIEIADRQIDDLRPHERRVAMVFQSYALYPHMTVAQNIGLPLIMQHLSLVERLPLIRHLSPRRRGRMSAIDQQVREIAAQLQIEHLLDRRPARLSGGQRQRVALGRAMVRDPDVFLMDEPLSNLDAKLRVHMRSELAELHQRVGATFIYVTHDQIEAMTMSDRVAMMDRGNIIQLGTPDELYRNPTNVTVASFIGSPGINLLPARRVGRTGLEVLGRRVALDVEGGSGTEWRVGIRPEALHIVAVGMDAGFELCARLRRRENLGADLLMYFDVDGMATDAVVVRVAAGQTFADTAKVRLSFAPSDCHVFDEQGRAPAHVIPRAGSAHMSTVESRLSAPARFVRQELIERLMGLGLAAPAFLLLLLTNLAPIAILFYLSVTDYQFGDLGLHYVGLKNFAKAMSDPVLRRSLWNTFIYVGIVVPGAVGVGLLVAVLVHGLKRGRAFYEIVYFLPVTSTLIAMATVWQFLLHPRLGPVNAVLHLFGIKEVAFLSEPSLVLPTLAVIGMWQLIGFNMVIFLAGLSAIPKDLYEAAEVDGCVGALDRFLTITWPLLGPTTMFVIVTTSITAFKIFDTVAVLTRGGPVGASEVLLYAIYLEGFQYFHTAYAAALTLIFLIFIVVFSAAEAMVLEKRVHY
jgi:ABC-type sugar transport system ATPase subunit/ABC-type sugar transport system permease subunit